MPRRGQRRQIFPTVQRPTPQSRIGVRRVHGYDSRRVSREVRLDPARFRCSDLAAELADEWVDYVDTARVSVGQARAYRQAIELFCRAVDGILGDAAAQASLGASHPDLGVVLAEWERALPTGYRPGSSKPAVLAATVRGLIARHAEPDAVRVDARLLRLVLGEVGVRGGVSSEIDEFSRRDKTRIVRAAWSSIAALERRLATGRERAGRGHHPATHGWAEIDNLLWGLVEQTVTPAEIAAHLPPYQDWPAELRACIAQSGKAVQPRTAKNALVRWLVRQLYPHNVDLHAYRVLLLAATGHAPEEVTALTEKDIEFIPGGVRLTLVKGRAGLLRHRLFADERAPVQEDGGPAGDEVLEFVDRPRREVSVILRSLLAATELVRQHAADPDGWVFMVAAIPVNRALRLSRWSINSASFGDWLDVVGISISGPPDARRIRKSTKVEKVIAFGGRVADAANDHHEETFRGHYAQGTTLRVLSGQVIATSQDHWLSRALDGPTVLTVSTEVLARSDTLEALGVSKRQAEQLRQGALDMGVSQCHDPHDSPYGRPGELCPVAPLRCLECRNAWILPSNLPQLLLFADHLERLRLRLSPQHFGALWGQSYVNLHTALAEHTDEEKAVARKHIDTTDISLHLPLSAHVEFDS